MDGSGILVDSEKIKKYRKLLTRNQHFGVQKSDNHLHISLRFAVGVGATKKAVKRFPSLNVLDSDLL